MASIVFGQTPLPPKRCLRCKHPDWQWDGKEWQCLNCATPNPCIRRFGKGPSSAECKDCTHLVRYHQAATWYKCELRKNTGGTGTDHRVHWPACAKFAPEHLQEGD
jgi:hypothetical protein